MSGAISKAHSFYFNVYLPAVVPCIIISEHNGKFEPLDFVEMSRTVQSSTSSVDNIKLSGSVNRSESFLDNFKLSDNIKPSIHQQMLSHQTMSNVKPSANVEPSDNVKPSNPKPSYNVMESNIVKPATSVKSLSTVKFSCSVKSPDSVKQPVSSTRPLDMIISCYEPCTTKGCNDIVLQTGVSHKHRTIPLHVVLKNLNFARHSVNGDGSCLYHSVAQQAGFITKTSCGDKVVSNHLRQVVYKMMNEHPCVRLEEGLSV